LFHARGAGAAQFIRFGGKTKFIICVAAGSRERWKKKDNAEARRALRGAEVDNDWPTA
jgi:hypothetical protein